MSVLDRSALEASPLADLHVIASELGHRRLPPPAQGRPDRRDRRAPGRRRRRATARRRRSADDDAGEPSAEPRERRGRRRGARGRRARAPTPTPRPRPTRTADAEARRRRRGRASRGRARAAAPRRRATRGARRADERDATATRGEDDATASPRASSSCSATARASCASTRPSPPTTTSTSPPRRSRRCELVSGDRVAGPVRAPRRSERYPSLVRVDTINGRPADEVAEGTRFDDLPARVPDRALRARRRRPDAARRSSG